MFSIEMFDILHVVALSTEIIRLLDTLATKADVIINFIRATGHAKVEPTMVGTSSVGCGVSMR